MKAGLRAFAAAWLLAAAALPAQAADADPAWTVAITQDGRALTPAAPGQPIALKRAAFEFVFEGPWNLSFGILAATRCQDVAGLKGADAIGQAIRIDNAAAESDDPKDNRFLVVNGPGMLAAGEATAHVWGEDAEEPLLSFQRRDISGPLRNRSRREVAQVRLNAKDRAGEAEPVARLAADEVCVLVTGMPRGVTPVPHTEPKLLRLRFAKGR